MYFIKYIGGSNFLTACLLLQIQHDMKLVTIIYDK